MSGFSWTLAKVFQGGHDIGLRYVEEVMNLIQGRGG